MDGASTARRRAALGGALIVLAGTAAGIAAWVATRPGDGSSIGGARPPSGDDLPIVADGAGASVGRAPELAGRRERPRAVPPTDRQAGVDSAGQDSVAALVDVLRGDEPTFRERRDAARALGEIGPDALDALVALVRGEDADTAILAMQALAAMGPEALSAVPVILDQVSREDVGGFVGNALIGIGPEAFPQAIALLESVHVEGRYALVEYISSVEGLPPESLDAFERLLDDRDRTVARRAVLSQAFIRRHGDRFVPALVRRLADSDARERTWALNALLAIGPQAEAAAVDVARLVDDASVGAVAAQTLAALGRGAGPATGVIVERAGDVPDDVRRTLLHALRNVGPWALAVAVRDGASDLRAAAADTVEPPPTGVPDPDLVAALVQALDASEPPVVAAAARALGRLGAADASARAVELARSGDAGVRAGALLTLAGAGASRGSVRADELELVRAGLRDRDGSVSTAAADAVTRLGSLASPLAADVVAALGRTGSPSAALCRACASLGPAASGAATALRRLASKDDTPLAAAAIVAWISVVRPPRDAAEARLAELQHHPSAELRSALLRAMSVRALPEFVAACADRMNDRNSRVRAAAATTLSGYGRDEAAAARGPLRRLVLDSRSFGKRQHALVTLRAIEASEAAWTEFARTLVDDDDERLRRFVVQVLGDGRRKHATTAGTPRNR